MKFSGILLSFLLTVSLHYVAGYRICTYGQFYNTTTSTCQNCSVCPEVTLRTCYSTKDTSCGSFKELFIVKDSQLYQQKTSSNKVDVTDVNEDAPLTLERSWHNVTVALTCILCSLCTILIVLVAVACVMYRNSRTDRQIYSTPLPVHQPIDLGKPFKTNNRLVGTNMDKLALLTDDFVPGNP